MKDLKTILLCLTIVSMSSASHHPQVYEDEVEYSKNEKIRSARDSESTYRTAHQPPVFNFGAARQQDYLKVRYAEQQKMNTVLVNGMAKSHGHFSQPQKKLYQTVQGAAKDAGDWQPFDPKIPKQNIRIIPGLHQFKITKDVKLYKPSLLKVGLIPKDVKLSLLNTNLPQIQGERNILNPIDTRNTDLEVQSTESVEKKIDLRQTPNEYSKIIFVHPNQLQGHLQENTGENLNQENADVTIKKPEAELTALNDLIGKNPNVQLEGLKRLLENSASEGYNYQTKQASDSLQDKEQTTITESKAEITNIKINPDDNSLTIQTPHLIGKESLDDIQKQLDEAAKIQAQQVLARAQQEAQAQVAAQHKAIALAQIQAQKVALENIQKSIYSNAQGLPSEENNQEDFHAVTNNVQVQAKIQPVSANRNIPSTSRNKIVHNPDHSGNALENGISVKNLASYSPSGTKPHVVSVGSGPRKPVALYENASAHAFGSKEVLYYAPNHHHQAAAQLQAEKALLSQVEAQNMAILHGHKHAPSVIRQILKNEQVSSAEQEGASNTQSVIESKPEATAYQQIILESKEADDLGEEQKDYDDLDDLQYAAKYAFGYRIKDAKEGNDFGHEERRDGKNLEGSYHVLLPDGRLQKVEYYADNSGYHAKVTYEHLAHEETSA